MKMRRWNLEHAPDVGLLGNTKWYNNPVGRQKQTNIKVKKNSRKYLYVYANRRYL